MKDMYKQLLILLVTTVSFTAYAQADLTFTVRKKKATPITIGWFDFDSLKTGKVYQIALSDGQGKIDQDSILCLRMDCDRYSSNGVDYLVFGRDKPGKAYIALYSVNPKNKKWRQNSMRPVVFLNDVKRLAQ